MPGATTTAAQSKVKNPQAFNLKPGKQVLLTDHN
jgi:hypothetical protein